MCLQRITQRTGSPAVLFRQFSPSIVLRLGRDTVEVFSFGSVVRTVMNLEGDDADLLTELCRRVDDAETIVASLRLSDVRVSVSANCRRDVVDGDAIVRPRILPAFKSRSPLRSTPSAANSGISAESDIVDRSRIGNVFSILRFVNLR